MSAGQSRAARSFLFVPGDRPERFDKAFACGADAVVIDLEDAVAPGQKEAARLALVQWCASHPQRPAQLVVRINDDASAWFEADLAVLGVLGPCLAMLPKAEHPGQVERVRAAQSADSGVIALIETARGLVQVDQVAQASGVRRLAFGTLDYALDLGLSDDPRGLIYPASRIALASRLAGLAAPIAGVTAAYTDEDAFKADLDLARGCGFSAKLCIHPLQVATLHRLLAPTAEQRAWAERIVAAAHASHGAVQVDGKMVDRPVLLRAEAILAHPYE